MARNRSMPVREIADFLFSFLKGTGKTVSRISNYTNFEFRDSHPQKNLRFIKDNVNDYR